MNSPSGGAGIIISAFLAGEIFIFVSEQVIEEVQRNIASKFPLLKEPCLNFLLAQPIIVNQPSLSAIKKAYQMIHNNDVPILAAAIKARPDFLITWNTKHFLKEEILQNVPLVICTPKEFLQKYWHRS